MNEKQLLDRLKQASDTILPPDSLSPDAIERMLCSAGSSDKAQTDSFTQNTAGMQDTSQTTANPGMNTPASKLSQDSSPAGFPAKNGEHPRKKHTSFYRYATRYGSLAAVFVLGITVLWQSNQISSLKENQAPLPQENAVAATEAQSETAAATEIQTETAAKEAADTSISVLTDTADSTTESEETKETDSSNSSANSDSEQKTVKAQTKALTYADSYEQIYNTIKSELGTSLYARDLAYDFVEDSASDTGRSYASDSAASPSLESQSDVQDTKDFSETNLQEVGVDEGDIVKTDGQYLYILKKDMTFSVIHAEGSTLTLCSTTTLDTSGLSNPTVKELYLDGDQLTVLYEGRQTGLEQDDDVYYTTAAFTSVLCTYDISDRNAPKQTGTLTQEGRYSTSRKVGSYLYLFTNYTPELLDNYAASTIAPRVNQTEIPASCFYLPEHLSSQQYLVITAVDLHKNASVTDQKVLVSGADHFYVSTEAIYIASENYGFNDTITELAKFRYENGMITGVAAASVQGYLNNSFSLNEYNGYLRAVSTYYDTSTNDWTEKNALTIFDANMNQVSLIDDLASGETIRSARFLGDTGYFVTFRQTDPLFCVDLSDPASPEIKSELKLTGFSSYLHFYGETLLGIGYEANENTGETTGVKLSMFDISDPENVKEISKTVISGVTWAPSIDDYKSILVDSTKNLIGFYCDGRYLVYSYDSEKGFQRQLVYDFFEDDLMDVTDFDTMRGLYIGDTLYLAGEGFVVTFDLTDGFSKQTVFRY